PLRRAPARGRLHPRRDRSPDGQRPHAVAGRFVLLPTASRRRSTGRGGLVKVKYSASLALVLWLGVVAWVSAMIVAAARLVRSFPDEDDSAAIAQLQITLNHNRSMLAAIDALDAVQADSLRGLAVAPGSDKPGSAGRNEE